MNRANVLGVGVHAVNLTLAADLIIQAASTDKKGYVCVTGVHGVMEAQRNIQFKSVLDGAMLVVPDGMPTVWIGRWEGYKDMGRVFGPELMFEVCQRSVTSGHKHFLYGGNPGVAAQLKQNLEKQFPGIQIVGTYTPPFRPLTPVERSELEARVATLNPDIIWIGLSTPKQEKFMADSIAYLNCKVMIGVGAAFDIHTGRVKDAPRWVKTAGLQWLHRLCQEPSRLWKRYLVNNSGFVLRTVLQLVGIKRYELVSPQTSAEY